MNSEQYKRCKEIVFLLWDNQSDYEDSETQTRIGDIFKNKHRVYNEENYQLSDVLKKYEDNPKQEFLLFIHLDHSKQNKGFKSFKSNSEIGTTYSNLHSYIISRVTKSEIYKDDNNNRLTVFSWDDLISEEGIDRKFTPQTVAQMKLEKETSSKIASHILNQPKIKYGIFTALWKEFKEVEELFDWDESLVVETDTTIYKIGKLKDTDKYVVGCFATKTGMVEAAVICSEMINKFEPDYLIMPGICGGEAKTNYGDIIVANKVFLLGNGKIKDNQEENNGIKSKAIPHYNGEQIDINKIVDSNGNPMRIVSEVLENEINAIDIDDKLFQKIEPKLEDIEKKINKPYKLDSERISVHFEPMACSLSVVDKEDYFEYEIKGSERKTKAVEMESYGVARASKKANGGKTKFLIFKSVMDKASLKTDHYKEKAAYTSAQFLRYLLEDNVI